MKVSHWLMLLGCATVGTAELVFRSPTVDRWMSHRSLQMATKETAASYGEEQLGRRLPEWRRLERMGSRDIEDHNVLLFLGSCAPCGLKFTDLCRSFLRRTPNTGVFLVATDTRRNARAFAQQAELPVCIDVDRSLAKRVSARYYPTALLVDHMDRIVAVGDVNDSVERALAEFSAAVTRKGRAGR
jgi:hypothetical protein